MKIQCSCGAKYSFDVTPESAATPVRFVCPNCGLDSSAVVNELIRRELAAQGQAPPMPAAPAVPPPIVTAAQPRLRISTEHAAPAAAPTASPAAPVAFCAKHSGETATEKCAICHKPICPKCMELFGYFCSPFCKAKAEANKVNVPVYEGLGSAVEARFWRKTGLIIKAGIAAVVLLMVLGVWYKFYLSVPHKEFSVHFDQRAEYGQCRYVGTDQLVFLHGGTLARYDLKSKDQVWSHELISQKDIDDAVAAMGDAETGTGMRLTVDQKQKMARQALEAGYSLLVSGSNVWLGTPAKLIHYDWDTGNVIQSVPLGAGGAQMIAGSDQILLVNEPDSGRKTVTDINYASGDTQEREFNASGKLVVATRAPANSGGGLDAAGSGQALDPNKVADQAQNLTTPGRFALPALLANDIHQRQIMDEVRDGEPQKRRPAAAPVEANPSEMFTLIPSPNGFLQISVNMLEKRITTRNAMKAPPAKKVMDGNLTAGQGTEAVNEMLNDMQRSKGGGDVQEDESVYQVKLRLPDAADAPDWVGTVTGSPSAYVLQSVNVIAAGSSVTVLDKSNKKLWDATLTYPVSENPAGPDGGPALTGACPVAERNGTLYVVDQALVTAFDLATGNAKWRLPSVGTLGLQFDNQGAIYVNTTTASLDKIKYSRQIDIAEAIDNIILKVDAESGKELWRAKAGGFAYYVSGPYVYTVLAHDEPFDDTTSDLMSVLQKPSFVRIMRLSPKNGQIVWEHDEDRAPLDIRFDKNTIYMVFHKEVEVLHYLTL